MEKSILVVREEKIGKIIFNSPNTFNALTLDIIKNITTVIEELESDPNIRVVLLTGKGGSFSAGADYAFMDALTTMSPSMIRKDIYQHIVGSIQAIKMCSKPTIAAVRGPAVGAGCEMAVACDFRIVSETAMFKEVWVQLGLISPLGGMSMLPRLVGLTKATEMFMLGKEVYGQEAARIGLANKCVADDKLDKEADTLAQELAKGAPLALAAIKEGLRRGMESTLSAEWEANSFVQAALLTSEDFKEAVAARKESRRPVFKGK